MPPIGYYPLIKLSGSNPVKRTIGSHSINQTERFSMQRSLLYPMLAIILTVTGCSSTGEYAVTVPVASSNPFVYQPAVQQGTVITQEMVNQLRIGMEKSQVRFVMGTATIVDTFHQDRWDYFYSLVEGGDLQETYRLTIFFKGGKLSSMQGDFSPKAEIKTNKMQEKVFDVPK